MSTPRALSVIIPAYNEADTLPAHLAILMPLLRQIAGEDWEVLVVDDGSTDSTAAIVESLKFSPRVRVLRSPVNLGKGGAIRLGVAATTGEMVLTCDADMATPPETLLSFVDTLRGGADIVIGNRRSPAARIERRQPWLRQKLGEGYLTLCCWMTGVKLEDYNCGFKLFRGEVARKIMSMTTTDGWAIDMESLALAARRNYRIAEVPVSWRDGARTSVRLGRDIPATLRAMLGIWWRLRRL